MFTINLKMFTINLKNVMGTGLMNFIVSKDNDYPIFDGEEGNNLMVSQWALNENRVQAQNGYGKTPCALQNI